MLSATTQAHTNTLLDYECQHHQEASSRTAGLGQGRCKAGPIRLVLGDSGPLDTQHLRVRDPLLKKCLASRSWPCEPAIIKAVQRDPAEGQT